MIASDTRSDAAAALRDILPAALAAVPIGVLFGALAAGAGLSAGAAVGMSALVFAGAAQFAALELWSPVPPVGAVLLSTLLINARHVLMGASLAPRLQRLAPWQRCLSVAVLADENWALAEHRAQRQPLTFAYVGTMGAVFWLAWVAATALGAVAGAALGDPARYGADFAFTAILIGLVAGLGRDRGTGLVIAASATASAAAFVLVGSPWHVPAGAVAGIAVAWAAPWAAARPEDCPP